MKQLPKRPMAGGTNEGLRPLRYTYWRVGYGSPEVFALDFWIERAGEFHTKPGTYEASQRNHPHSSQFYFHLDGAAVVEGSKGGVVSAGDVLAMPVGVPFRYHSPGVIRYHWFSIPHFWPIVLGSADEVHWLARGFDAELEARFTEIREILILGKPGYMLRAIGVFYELLARVMERSSSENNTSSTYPESVRNALTYLRENTTMYDAVGTATAVGLSQSHLRALFEKWVGESPKQFHTRCRMDEARRLLQQGDLTVSQVALQVGFHDARYFSRVFKQVTGISPSRYTQNRSTDQTDQTDFHG